MKRILFLMAVVSALVGVAAPAFGCVGTPTNPCTTDAITTTSPGH